jgi:hypothetical protein
MSSDAFLIFSSFFFSPESRNKRSRRRHRVRKLREPMSRVQSTRVEVSEFIRLKWEDIYEHVVRFVCKQRELLISFYFTLLRHYFFSLIRLHKKSWRNECFTWNYKSTIYSWYIHCVYRENVVDSLFHVRIFSFHPNIAKDRRECARLKKFYFDKYFLDAIHKFFFKENIFIEWRGILKAKS